MLRSGRFACNTGDWLKKRECPLTRLRHLKRFIWGSLRWSHLLYKCMRLVQCVQVPILIHVGSMATPLKRTMRRPHSLPKEIFCSFIRRSTKREVPSNARTGDSAQATPHAWVYGGLPTQSVRLPSPIYLSCNVNHCKCKSRKPSCWRSVYMGTLQRSIGKQKRCVFPLCTMLRGFWLAMKSNRALQVAGTLVFAEPCSANGKSFPHL